MVVEADGEVIEATTQLVTASNAPLVGMQALIAPNALLDDGYLDLALYGGMSKPELAWHFIASLFGRWFPGQVMTVRQARTIHIRPTRPRPASADMKVLRSKRGWTIEALPGILEAGEAKGLRFVTVGTLLEKRAPRTRIDRSTP